jgi:hypothetical protein
MTRWIGLALLLISVPLFLYIRESPRSQSRGLLRRVIHVSTLLIGFFGVCLILFGNPLRALVVLGVWCGIAWLYNR